MSYPVQRSCEAVEVDGSASLTDTTMHVITLASEHAVVRRLHSSTLRLLCPHLVGVPLECLISFYHSELDGGWVRTGLTMTCPVLIPGFCCSEALYQCKKPVP